MTKLLKALMSFLLAVTLSAGATGFVAGCEEEAGPVENGPVEETGEEIEETGEDVDEYGEDGIVE